MLLDVERFLKTTIAKRLGESRMLVGNLLDCDILVNEFELQSCYNGHFQINALGKRVKPLISPTKG